MAYTELTLQASDRDGTELTFSAATAGGEAFDNSGQNVLLVVNNGSAGAVVVTIETPGTVDGAAIADKTGSVAAGEIAVFGPFPKAAYNQADGDTGLSEAVRITTDTQTSITLAALRVGSLAY